MINTTQAGKRKCGDPMYRDLIRRIESGELRPGDRLANGRTLAERYGISEGTAQLVLSNLVGSGHLVRQNGVGTFVARQESWQPIDVVGYMVHATYNPYHLSVLSVVSREAKAIGARLLVGDALKASEFIRSLKNENCRYLIRPPFWNCTEHEIWELVQQEEINTVIINDFWLNGGPLNCVSSDIALGVSQMMNHLLGLGHRQIMFLDEDEAMCPRALGAFTRSLEYNGIQVNRQLVRFELHDNFIFTPRLLDEIYNTCTAVLVTHDYYAVKLAEAFTAAGREVGREISIAGIDSISETLTSVEHPVEAVARQAFKLLASGRRNCKVMIPPTCRFRASTAPPSREVEPHRFIYDSRTYQIRPGTHQQQKGNRK